MYQTFTQDEIKKIVDFCYYPVSDSDMIPIKFFIESIVLPNGVRCYNREEIEYYIKKYIKEN